MSLASLYQSTTNGEVLIPALKKFLTKHNETGDRKAFTLKDAKMTISWGKMRIEEYNHDTPIEGELFHPSAIGGCIRRMWFSAYQAPENASPNAGDLLKSHITFEIGTYIHVLIQNLCEQAGLLVEREIAINNVELKTLGHADGKLKIDGKFYLFEIKSINDAGFSRLKEPKPEHVGQMHLYMKALGLKRGILLYINKNTSLVKEFVVLYSEKDYKEIYFPTILRYFRLVKKMILPMRISENPRGYPCMFCEFSRVCFDSAALAKFRKNLKPLKPR